ncbi:lytic transglycosylase domain-containing protein [Bradyrhizobium liaoningense]|uniref:lytic transglycosylase domain-containing protein n=1 Tax=Bradyrhizobium liaoningense TaxID=43992 RepID=UPI00289B6148|nr:lytic transglycosylase domain-containing protein [Bradyrhizobium liaoningense]
MPLLFVLSIVCSFVRADEQEVAHPTRGQTTGLFEHFIGEAAQRFVIPVQWIQSILRIESDGDAHAKSGKGAIGLMQIMPATWAEFRQRYDLGNDPYDPHDNILAGAAYLRELFDRSASSIFPAQSDRIVAVERQQLTASRGHAPSAIVPKPTGIFVVRLDAGERR